MGTLELRNRIIMAPLTRMRASNAGHVPTDLHAEYYAQRASAGLIIGEGTEISPDAYGWADSPSLWSAEQVLGWRRVTDAVHKEGSFMYAQLWHTGAMSHPDFFEGALPMSASAVNPEQESVTPSGRKPTVTPRPMSKAEIRHAVADFGVATKNALEAGFDGVQIQANFLYLIAQFLCIRTKGLHRLSRVVRRRQLIPPGESPMNSPTTKNRQILLASRPSGEPSEENFNPAKQRWFVPWLCLPNCWSVLILNNSGCARVHQTQFCHSSTNTSTRRRRYALARPGVGWPRRRPCEVGMVSS